MDPRIRAGMNFPCGGEPEPARPLRKRVTDPPPDKVAGPPAEGEANPPTGTLGKAGADCPSIKPLGLPF